MRKPGGDKWRCDSLLKLSKEALIYSVRGEPFDKFRANGPNY